jgi:hypothetical protein
MVTVLTSAVSGLGADLLTVAGLGLGIGISLFGLKKGYSTIKGFVK